MFLGSFVILSFNEGAAVRTAKSLDETRSNVRSIDLDRFTGAPDGQLVHVAAPLRTLPVVKDTLFGVSIRAVRLERAVDMFQFVENQRERSERAGAGSRTKITEYTYDQAWRSDAVDSSRFDDRRYSNPTTWPFRTSSEQASKFFVGELEVSGQTLNKLVAATQAKQVDLTSHMQKLRDDSNNQVQHGQVAVASTALVPVGNTLYSGAVDNPRVGDLRVEFKAYAPQSISVIGLKSGSRVLPFPAPSGDDVLLVAAEELSAESLIEQAVNELTIRTWAFRAGGFVLMWVGLLLVFSPAQLLADAVPLVGGVLSSIVGFGTCLAALLASAALSSATIALAWIYYRPLVAIAIVAVGVLPTLLARVGGHNRRTHHRAD